LQRGNVLPRSNGARGKKMRDTGRKVGTLERMLLKKRLEKGGRKPKNWGSQERCCQEKMFSSSEKPTGIVKGKERKTGEVPFYRNQFM